MLRAFPPSPASANAKFKPLDPMSKDQLALEAKDGTIKCDHPACEQPLDTSLCTERCVIVECDAGVVNEQCEQGCVVDRAYGCPYEGGESGFARANGDVSIACHLFPKNQQRGNCAALFVSLPICFVQLLIRLRVYALQRFVPADRISSSPLATPPRHIKQSSCH
jgi:hypothetical protein